ncbi:beta-N-acetylhexosaminidase [Halovulum sp. GXIMD14793]
MARAVIFGCAGPVLDQSERAFLAEADPWGFILFARNLETPDQIRRLTADLRDAVGRDAPILIDQEGGRVARLRAPDWTEWPAPLDFLDGFPDLDTRVAAMRLRYHVIAAELRDLGIDVNCAPMADIAQPHTHPILRNRCYGREADQVVAVARAVADGLGDGGVLPVLKHIPGHGRPRQDSHAELPVVEESAEVLAATDFAAFAGLSDLPMAMTAHVIYTHIDPENCATLSPRMIDIIRRRIGFDGLLMTDDLSMHALSGPFSARVKQSLQAGCDLMLHCNGHRQEMEEVASATPDLAGKAADRAEAALAARPEAKPINIPDALAQLARLGPKQEQVNAR